MPTNTTVETTPVKDPVPVTDPVATPDSVPDPSIQTRIDGSQVPVDTEQLIRQQEQKQSDHVTGAGETSVLRDGPEPDHFDPDDGTKMHH